MTLLISLPLSVFVLRQWKVFSDLVILLTIDSIRVSSLKSTRLTIQFCLSIVLSTGREREERTKRDDSQ